jgi:hypothetical protein
VPARDWLFAAFRREKAGKPAVSTDIAEELQARVRPEPREIRPLTQAARDRHSVTWQAVSGQFASDPSTAVRAADRLVGSVLAECGYPVDEPAVAADEPEALRRYRAARELARRDARRAMDDFGALLGTLTEPSDHEAPRPRMR